MQWHTTLLPRVHCFVPAATILELAPGYGRWSAYLKDLCTRLVLVDLAPNCIDHCRRRFAAESHIDYLVNDGRSLAGVEDASIDFFFTFDSLVHAEQDVLDAYVGELDRVLAPRGVAFIHHSNFAAAGVTENPHSRGVTASSRGLAEASRATGLHCFAQELINWGGASGPIDCLSIIARRRVLGADGATRTYENPEFHAEAIRSSNLAELYGFRTLSRLVQKRDA
jgi:SAM-dependent methyltransferase